MSALAPLDGDRPSLDRPAPDWSRFAPEGCAGKPALAVPYRDKSGMPLVWVCRWDGPDGKEIRPFQWVAGQGWRPGLPQGPRPILALDMLAANLSALVLVVEGEKVAVAARKFLPLGWLVTTSIGGAMAAAKADWSPLAGRTVVVWPDNDPAGEKYASDVVRLACERGAAAVGIVPLPADLPPAWDLADALPAGWSAETVRAMIEDASEPTAPAPTAASEPVFDLPGWPPLDRSILATEALPPPDFPAHILGSWAGWVRDASVAAGAPIDYVGWSLIGFIGGLLGAARRVRGWGDFSQPGMIWVGLVGNPSSGKSPSMTPIRKALGVLEAEWAASHTDAEVAHKDAVAVAELEREVWRDVARSETKAGRAAPAAPADPPPPPVRRRVMVGDATRESLCAILADEPRGLINATDELAAWFGGMDAYSGRGADRALYLSCYDGNSHTVDRVKSGAKFIPAAAISILGSIQPDRLAEMLHDAEADDGLLSRFIWIWPNAVPPARTEVRADVDRLIRAARWLRSLPLEGEDDSPKPRVLPVEEGAAQILEAFAQDLHGKTEQGLLGSAQGKWRGLALRLAMTLEFLAATDCEVEPAAVTAGAMATACGLIDDYVEPMARRCYGDSAAPQVERDARRIAQWLISSGAKTINGRSLARDRKIQGLYDPSRVSAAIEDLVECGVLREAPTREGRGRKAREFIVRPGLGAGR